MRLQRRQVNGSVLQAGIGAALLRLARPPAALADAAHDELPAPAPAPASLARPLTVSPDTGYIGDAVSVSADGLTPGQQVELQWATWDGQYVTKPAVETIEFYEHTYTEKRVTLGKGTVGLDGTLNASFTVPEDFGEVHDLYVTGGGQDIAHGGFRVLPEFSASPLEGPIGTPITIRVRGASVGTWESMWNVVYDNHYAGFMSAITTHGIATAVIRASGWIGTHTIDLFHGGKSLPYLNWEQSPQGHIPVYNFKFFVTSGSIAPPVGVDWPHAAQPTAPPPGVVTTTSSQQSTTGLATITPAAGPILSDVTLRATNLVPNTPAEVFWVTARGSRTTGLGWALDDQPLGTVTADPSGAIRMPITIPDDLGGWHSLQVVQNNALAAETFYLVQPSVVEVTPQRVRAGDAIQIHLKGVGWTELDNIYTVVYDTAYTGFACGFNSNGDVTINLHASGEPGVHLIDLYPAVYQGHGKPPFQFDTPMLTYADDHPSLAFGYRLPAFRLAITITD